MGFGWILLVLALVFGLAGAALAAYVATFLFWIGQVAAIVCLVVFFVKYSGKDDRQEPSPIQPAETVSDEG